VITDPISHLQQLQREKFALRRLLDGNLSEHTRPRIEEILLLVQEEIDRERTAMAAGA